MKFLSNKVKIWIALVCVSVFTIGGTLIPYFLSGNSGTAGATDCPKDYCPYENGGYYNNCYLDYPGLFHIVINAMHEHDRTFRIEFPNNIDPIVFLRDYSAILAETHGIFMIPSSCNTKGLFFVADFWCDQRGPIINYDKQIQIKSGIRLYIINFTKTSA